MLILVSYRLYVYSKCVSSKHGYMKRTTKTFIGGLFIGIVGGAFVSGLTVWVVMNNYIISTFN